MMSGKKLAKRFAVSTLALLLIACGGGGGGGGAPPLSAPIGNISGTWTITETARTANDSACQPPAEPLETFNLAVTQDGNALTVVDAQNNVFMGTISGNTVSWTGSYPEPPGTTTITSLSATIASSCNTLQGTSNWTYSETGFSCAGTTTFTGTRSPASGCGGDGDTTSTPEVEPNDTTGQAQTITLPATITGSIIGSSDDAGGLTEGSDIDVFSFTVSATRTVTAALSSPSGTADIDLLFANTDGTIIDQTFEVGSNDTLTREFAPGTYLVVVVPFDVPTETSYTLTVE